MKELIEMMKTVKNVFLTDEEILRLQELEIYAHNSRSGVRMENEDVDFLKNHVGFVTDNYGRYGDKKEKIRWM